VKRKFFKACMKQGVACIDLRSADSRFQARGAATEKALSASFNRILGTAICNQQKEKNLCD
jgi:hypothetical protein